ncbi:tRNA(His) 5'-end guanylyltransferase [Mycolicibacterium sp. BK634]|uniref:tRNA(His) guanylyltransferase Thg1 family protein n=1 Tax=Mycolicibacterium sp. BK634 TaxID=2587099 RepID=UPI00160C0DF1|nr:tRNA(His) guanylyltransferase Thg1 family protein [Mycolicibacterium sp. BK634]MBB3752437.1 tRNA(His) 5'-end guanylyltransferase [Mycolicibacterium sp. BK634]
MSDTLGDRIKRYERAYNHTLTPRMPVIIRVDGRAFHTLTRHLNKPFDHTLMSAMVNAAIDVSRDMQGFKLGYHQSDEVSFLLTDYDQLDTQGWFGYELNKIVSLTASLFTAHFYANCPATLREKFGRVATFDARAFNVPAEDVPNVFIWRQRDWERNSLQMLAHFYFSHSELQCKGRREMHDMLHGIGINWADLSSREKNGTWILHDGDVTSERWTYPEIEDVIAGAMAA